uniref:RWD domain-containing protein n=1 Tax=Anopheles culicifacies TaxID=139723 RepID=A0A182LXV0_9DIPT
MDALLDEVESLEAILMDDVHITKNASGFPEMIETTVFPTVGEELESQYVCITLQVLPAVGYPDVRPNVKLRNPRGLDDNIIGQIERAVQQKLTESIGQPVVFDLIDIIREQLTASNLPSGQCVICLYGFLDGDEFTKTVCYHYLHSHCLACHINASKRNYEEEIEKLPIWKRKEAKPFQAQCPVCRESIDDVEVEPLMRCRPPAERENAPKFKVTDELKSLQAQMNRLFMHQKRRGGIIDLEAEEGNVIAIETESPNGEIPKGTNDTANNGPSAILPEVKTAANKKHGTNAQHAKGSSSSKATSNNNATRPRNNVQAATTLVNGEANDDPDACTDPCCSGQNDHHRGRNRRHNNHHHNRHQRHHHNHHHHHHHHQQHQGRGGGAGGAGTSTAAGGAAKNLGTPCASDAR